ncbi:hypothetical protein [Enterobacter roggenkampii]|uniref:hypothetical protein n=1 Tax=Enterobacter roggenkampii TaxID=1812935 RepID=UPI002DB7E06F|nr:hypothetical protein [Enterobacter roggenkampii]MEB5890008.1 hypothetical protein [Enterobacter roggenkampii]
MPGLHVRDVQKNSETETVNLRYAWNRETAPQNDEAQQSFIIKPLIPEYTLPAEIALKYQRGLLMENNDNSGTSLLSVLLEKIDTWKKLVIFIILFIVAGVGYCIYLYRDAIFFLTLDAMSMPEIDYKKIDSEAKRLAQETKAISVVVWKVDLESNHREAVYINIAGVRDSVLEGAGDLVLRKKAKLTEVIIELLENDTACSEITDDSSVAKALVAAGVTYTCLVSIPPRYDEIVGVISLGFATRPVNEDYIRRRLLQASQNITR